jgi:hypothetical protein
MALKGTICDREAGMNNLVSWAVPEDVSDSGYRAQLTVFQQVKVTAISLAVSRFETWISIVNAAPASCMTLARSWRVH